MAPLILRVLGPPRLELHGESIALNLRRAVALLVYLAVTAQPQSRDALAALLWPESDDREARARLRRTLHRLGEAIGDDKVLGDGDTLCLAPGADPWVDSLAFEQQATAGLAAHGGPGGGSAEGIAHLAQAAALYTGDFLEGFGLPDNPAWDEWQFYQREGLRQRLARVLERLVEAHQARETWEAAIPYGRRWVALDPLHEPAQRALMRLHALTGQHAAAVRQYQECVRILETELGVPPDDETRALYEAIRARRLAPRPRAAVPPGATASPPVLAPPAPPSEASPLPLAGEASGPVGREPELDQLHHLFDQALSGKRQVVLVTGEPGLGKTSLVELFVRAACDRASLWIGHGQCLEHRGAAEAYMPVLEALGRLCAAPGGEAIVALLAQRAPTWLVQMPWLVTAAAFETLQQRALGATRERMLREMAESLETLTADRPLLLVLEDLHWADYSTVDLLTRLAHRQEPARLLVIGTYRPADAMMQEHPLHPLAQELRIRGHGVELPLTFLTEQAVEEYLARRFRGTALPDGLARLIHERTDGNPLFMVNLVDSWVAAGLLSEDEGQWTLRTGLDALASGVPESLRALIAQQLARLRPEEQEVLEVASVGGMQFATAAVAAGLTDTEEQVETRCAALARRGQFVQESGIADWADGTVATEFTFIHHLYRQVLYERVPAGRQVRLHREIGARLEAGYVGKTRQRASELAVHFVRGRDVQRAVLYLRLAAEQALQRSAHREGIEQLTSALALLRTWPDTRERAEQELRVQTTLAPALIATRGWAASELEVALVRAHELCQQLDDTPLRSQVLFGLAALYEWRGEYERAQVLMEQRLQAHDRQQDGHFLLESYDLLACSLFHQGLFTQALDQAEHGLALYTPDEEHSLLATFGEEPEVQYHGWAALALWFLGYPDRALERAHTGLRLAQDHLYSLASAQTMTAWIHQCRREYELTRQWAEVTIELATTQGFPYRVAVGRVLRGWALAAQGHCQEGIADLRAGLEACLGAGARLDQPYFLALLADAYRRDGQVEEGLRALDEALALVHDSRRFFYEAELHRLRGALFLQAGAPDAGQQAERYFQEALETARRQKARALELRAATSLGRLWRNQARAADARSLLATTLGHFGEGFATGDYQAASTLLDELAGAPGAALAPGAPAE
jgi:DNA-binding SARP family transcriptional activator/predicted ATPase